MKKILSLSTILLLTATMFAQVVAPTGTAVSSMVAIKSTRVIPNNYVNTTFPWADNELSDTLTVGSGGSVHLEALEGGTVVNQLLRWDTNNWVANIKLDDSGSAATDLFSAQKINALVSTVSSGIDIHAPVATSTEGLNSITLSGEQTLNGVLTSSSRVLVMEQGGDSITPHADNGIYVSSGVAWARATDMDADADLHNGLLTQVTDPASAHYLHQYIVTTPDPIALGTAFVFSELPNPVFGTTAGTTAEGDDSRIVANTAKVSADGSVATHSDVTAAQATAIGNLSGTNTGDQTNISGNAATVTTNANLTGHVTSTGNAAVLGSFTVAQLSTALSDATLSGNNTGDQDLSSYMTLSTVINDQTGVALGYVVADADTGTVIIEDDTGLDIPTLLTVGTTMTIINTAVTAITVDTTGLTVIGDATGNFSITAGKAITLLIYATNSVYISGSIE